MMLEEQLDNSISNIHFLIQFIFINYNLQRKPEADWKEEPGDSPLLRGHDGEPSDPWSNNNYQLLRDV
jgi:hypothetical protein